MAFLLFELGVDRTTRHLIRHLEESPLSCLCHEARRQRCSSLHHLHKRVSHHVRRRGRPIERRSAVPTMTMVLTKRPGSCARRSRCGTHPDMGPCHHILHLTRIRGCPTMPDSLLHIHNTRNHALYHLDHILHGLHMDLTLEMSNNMTHAFLCLTDQQLARVNDIGSAGTRGCHQSCIPKHRQDLFLITVLRQLLLTPLFVLFLDAEYSAFAIDISLILLLMGWAEQDQVEIEVLCQVGEQWKDALHEAIVGCGGIGRGVPHNGLHSQKSKV